MDVAGVVFQIDAGPAEAGARRALTALDQLEARIDAFVAKAKQIQKELGAALSVNFRGGGSGGGASDLGKAEAAAIRHAQKLEQITRQSATRIRENEARTQSQIALLRERNAQRAEEAERKRVAQAEANAAKIAAANAKAQSQVTVARIGRAETRESNQSKLEREALRSAGRIEAIATQSAGKIAEIEAKKLAQIELLRERAAQKELDRQKRLANQPQTAGAVFLRNASTIREAGESIQQAGDFVSRLSNGFLNLGQASVKSAVDIDKQVNVLKALTGSAAAAESRFQELFKLSQNTPGLTTQTALSLDAQLRLANVSQPTVNRFLQTTGRLNAVQSIGSADDFANNLRQLVDQGFERADLKQVVNRNPIAGELIKTVFGVDNPTNSEAIRAAAQQLGITTAEKFFDAFARAGERNDKLRNATQSIEVQFEKLQDRVSVALRPLGVKILDSLLPALERLIPVVERVFDTFSKLSPTTQNLILGLGALAVATGPVISGFGAMVQLAGGLGNLIVVVQKLSATSLEAGSSVGVLSRVMSASLHPAVLLVTGALIAGAVTWFEYERQVNKSIAAIDSAADRARRAAGEIDFLNSKKVIVPTTNGKTVEVTQLNDQSSQLEFQPQSQFAKGLKLDATGQIKRDVAALGALSKEERQLAQANARLATTRKDYAGAEKILTDALARTTKGTKEAIQLETQLEQIRNRRSGGGGVRGTTSDSGLNARRDAEIRLREAQARADNQITRESLETQRRFLDLALGANLVSYRTYYGKRASFIEADARLDRETQEKRIAEQRDKITELETGLAARLQKARTPGQKESVQNQVAREVAESKAIILTAEEELRGINERTTTELLNNANAVIAANKQLEESVFGVRRAFLELSGKGALAQVEEDTRKANEEIQKLLVNGKFIAALQAAQNRDTRNNRTRASGIGEEVDLRRQQADVERVRIQNDLNLGVIGEGEARQRILAVEGELREAIAKRLEAQLLSSRGDEKAVAAIRRQIDELRTLATDERALREQRAKTGFLNDKAFVDTARAQAKDERLSEQESTAKEIIRLQEQIASAGEGSADRIQAAYLRAFRSLQEENERAVEEVIAAQVKLQNNTSVDPARLNDGVIKLLATQKTLQESLQDFRTNQVQTVFDGIEQGVDKLTEKFGAAGKAINQLLKDLAKLAVSKLFERVLGIAPSGGASVAPQQRGGFSLGGLFGGGGQSSGGGLLGGVLGGGQSSPASFLTGGFAGGNPAQSALGGQGIGGGLFSKLPVIGKLFGGVGNAAGVGGKIGANIGSLPGIGTFNIPGLSTPGIAASGVSGAAGSAGGSAGVLGGLFSNPVTAAVAIGAIAAPFVIKLFRGLFGGGEFKKFQQQVQGLYQIKVDGKQEGKALFEAVKGLGEQAFGKGSFKNKISETIQLKKAQEAIAAYGESTGQTDSPLVKKLIKKREIGDATASDNNFVRRATGGIVPGIDTGRDYVRALLRGGEFVTVPEVVQSQGRGRFDALNKGEARILTNKEMENLRRALQSVPFFSRGMRERILGQLNLRESVSGASFNRGYANGGYVMPNVQAFANGGYVFPQTQAMQSGIEQATARTQTSNAAQSVASGAQASQAASQREAALTNELRGNRVVMARLVEVLERLDGFDANTIVGMASPDAVARKTNEGYVSDSTLASQAQQHLGLRT